jgi:hypothetical protein
MDRQDKLEYQRKWRQANKEKIKRYAEDWRTKNPEYNREWHAKHPGYRRPGGKEYDRQHQAEKQSMVATYKLDKNCADCYDKQSVKQRELWGNTPEVFDFDHVRGEKLFSLAKARTRSLEEIVEEMEKCDVVCANCHRIRTATRRAGK